MEFLTSVHVLQFQLQCKGKSPVRLNCPCCCRFVRACVHASVRVYDKNELKLFLIVLSDPRVDNTVTEDHPLMSETHCPSAVPKSTMSSKSNPFRTFLSVSMLSNKNSTYWEIVQNMMFCPPDQQVKDKECCLRQSSMDHQLLLPN